MMKPCTAVLEVDGEAIAFCDQRGEHDEHKASLEGSTVVWGE